MIQMKCPSCDSKLKVADKLAGRTIACPGCKQKIEVPAVESSGDEFAETGDDGGMPNFSELAASSADQPAAASGDRTARRKQTCPMCGEKVSPSAKQCPSCGESLSQGSASGLESAPVSVSDALGRAWRLTNRNQGLVIGAFLIYSIPSLFSAIVNAIAESQANQGGGGGGLQLMAIGINICFNLVQAWLYLGYVQILLNVAMGRKASLDMVFSKGNLLLSFIGAGIIAFFAVVLGLLALIIGAFIVGLLLQPMPYVLVDQNAGPIDCVTKSFSLGWSNFGTMFLMSITTFGLALLGLLMCGFGMLVTVPLALLMQAILYAMMTNQPVAGEAT